MYLILAHAHKEVWDFERRKYQRFPMSWNGFRTESINSVVHHLSSFNHKECLTWKKKLYCIFLKSFMTMMGKIKWKGKTQILFIEWHLYFLLVNLSIIHFIGNKVNKIWGNRMFYCTLEYVVPRADHRQIGYCWASIW